MKGSNFHHLHVHSSFSTLDALSSVPDIVAKAARLGHPAVALTDHGNMSGTVQLYKAGKLHGIQVYPGMEGYLTTEPITDDKENGKLKRYHIGLLALNLEGYRALTKLSSLSHTRPRFFQKFPRFDLNDLAEFSLHAGENVAVMTGCFFGLVQQALMDKGPKAATRIVEMYARWFPNLFVELQNHDIEHPGSIHDADICEALYDIAQQVGVPVVVTQDSHYLKQSERKAHNLLKKMTYGGADDEFPGDFFHLASTEWVEEHHDPIHWKAAEEGFEELLDLNEVEIPALDVYTSHVPSTKPYPHRWLRKLAHEKLKEFKRDGKLAKEGVNGPAWRRLEHELEIINFCGAAGYFSIWHDFVRECKKRKICIEARGSANGSLVCYLLGITQIDPLQWGLLFERFMSKDRQKPPDIDMDIEDSRRMEMIEWISQRPGFEVMQIGTFNALGAREDDDKGSVLVTYNAYLRKQLGQRFVPLFGRGIEQISDVERYNYRDYEALRLLSQNEVKKSAGVHAAGLLLSGESQRIEDYVPSMLIASSDTLVTQFTQDDVEELGYLKMDLLGQKTLAVMRRCQELMGREDPTDFSWIPLDDKLTCKQLSSGQGDNGIFQFEGYAMANGARVMKIRNTYDCVLAGALFRPACMDSGVTDTYIERRFDPSLRKNLEFPHPAFKEILTPTNGVVLFQEQVLEIMRRLGVSFAEINTFFKMVKDSGKGATERNRKRAAEVKKRWQEICDANGIADPEDAWHYIEGYVKYGFNKAHSAGYGVRAYRVAYLKTHYPLQYMTALLESWAGRPKEAKYIKEARRIGIHLLSPDVNISNANWTIDENRGAIRKGLASIKGIGKAAEEIAENRPYKTVDDLIEKNSARAVSGGRGYVKDGTWSGNLEKLKVAGALSSLGIRRDE